MDRVGAAADGLGGHPHQRLGIELVGVVVAGDGDAFGAKPFHGGVIGAGKGLRDIGRTRHLLPLDARIHCQGDAEELLDVGPEVGLVGAGGVDGAGGVGDGLIGQLDLGIVH